MGCTEGTSVATGDKAEVIFVIGGPGSGKGTQCKQLKDIIHYEHVSTGDILRNVVKEQKDPKWQELKEKMDKGEFVPSSDVIGFIKGYFQNLKNKKVLLDGFPVNQENIDEWQNQMKDSADLKAVLYFNCTPEEMQKRMAGRNEGREDDKEDAMKTKIDKFNSETLPLVEKYRGLGVLIEVDAMKGVNEVLEETKQKLADKGIK